MTTHPHHHKDKPMKFHVCNASPLLDDVAAPGLIAQACDLQILNHAGDRWGRYGTVDVVKRPELAPSGPGHCLIGIYDDADQADALGWHTQDTTGRVYGRVFVKPILESGGDFYSNPTLSVSSVLSHEVLETLVDPYVGDWWQRPDGVLVAAEVGDPVQGDSYAIPVLGKPVQVSNFILPGWRDAYTKGIPYDYLGRLHAPFTMTPGGYMIVMSEGKSSAVYGERCPEWKRQAIAAGQSARASHRARHGFQGRP